MVIHSLSTANLGSDVKSDDLSTNEVVASSDVRRDLKVDLATVVVHVLSSPVLGVGVAIACVN
jgi:hypothetical protein